MTATDIYVERDAHATFIVRTPYGRSSPAIRSWVGRNMTVIAQDVAGRFDADGEWLPYGDHEANDGYRLLRHAQHIGAHKPVVLGGASYEAFTALETERALLQTAGMSPHLVAGVIAMVPALGLWETAHRADGSDQLYHRIGWWAEHGFTRRPATPLTPAQIQRRQRAAEADGYPAAFADRPDVQAAWQRLWQAPPRDFTAWAHPQAAPILIVTGVGCPLTDHAWRLAHQLHERGRHVTVLDGPWGHRLMADLPPTSEVGQAVRASGGLRRHVDAWLAQCLRGELTPNNAGRLITITPSGDVHTSSLTEGAHAA